jgi:hypothetical protein
VLIVSITFIKFSFTKNTCPTMKLLTQQTLKGIFYPKSVFTILLALVTVFACEVEEPVPTYTLTTSVTPSEGGKIILSPQEPNYVEGSTVTLTPEPNENWVFKQWEGDATGNTRGGESNSWTLV